MGKNLVYLLLVCNTIYTYSQSSRDNVVSKDSSKVELITNSYIPFKLLKSNLKIFENYQHIQGSPYVENSLGNRNIPLCKIFDSKMTFLGSVLGFYNAYTDEMEISAIDNGLDYYLLKKNADFLHIKFSNKTYKAYEYNYMLNYFIILSKNDHGNCTLLKKEKVFYSKGSSQTVSLVKGEEASFIKARDSYYLKIDARVFKVPKNKKSFFALFGEKTRLIKTYVKQNKLKINSESDLLSIARYYNSLD